MEKTNKNKTSVSDILDRGLGKKKYILRNTKRGKIMHNLRARFYRETLKTGSNIRINHTILSQRATESRNKILAEIRNKVNLRIYYKDVNTLLKALYKELMMAAKNYAREHNWTVIPQELESGLFGGIVSFEYNETGMIEGVVIDARVDDLIETDSEQFIIGEFKSYPLDGAEPSNPASKSHRDFLQACIYAIILEENRGQECLKIVLNYYPNKVLSYEFTDEFRNEAMEYVRENGLNALGFERFTPKEVKHIKSSEAKETKKLEGTDVNAVSTRDADNLGWVNTDKSKPLELIKDKENKLEGYLWANKAEYVRDGDYVAVERMDGIRIICIVEHIKCFEENTSIVLKRLNESVYIIKLNPIMELHPEGPRRPRPQTIIQGKITPLKESEFYQFKKIPDHGITFGWISDIDNDYRYHFDPLLFYQGIFIGGTQGTGKTSAIRFMTLSTAPQPNSPAIIIFDAENEFSNLPNIPSTEKSMQIMARLGINPVDSDKLEIITLTDDTDWCLTLQNIDPKHLLLFLHELPHVSSTLLQRIIQDIKYDNPDREFTFPELRDEIICYMDCPEYRLNASVRDAISRSLLSVTLDLFDRPRARPINIEQMLDPGKITVIDCFQLDDDQQRVVALYLLAVFHKYKMKLACDMDSSNLGVLFVLDEVTRILPRLLVSSDYQKRIIHFLSEIQHRGRKRKYGVIYATQHPKDINKELVDLCNTKIFFLVEGSGCVYLKDYLNAGQREQLKRLPVGHAYILSKGKHEPQIIKFPFIN